MTDVVRYERMRERNFFDELLSMRDQQREHRKTAEILVKGELLPWELNRQGYMKWYMAPTMDDVVMSTYIMYLQKIPPRSRSGKQLTQGHQLGFVWKGSRGHTVVDDVRYDWAHRDLIQIPLRTLGCVAQHFNDGADDVEIMFCSLNTVHSAWVDRGAGFEQVEDCPEYREMKRAAGR